ncbi:MBTPS2 [Cordylochernes scorpioides]|uniref:Membrane-bound transcription factor site-2 protease n=1 Tax=Cordylochernes scorpioides TaxID=51811 RepID=A0ABY6KHV3_9ARAC|nr:MBTPS2 [Cordylochernes scorpioides]
MQVGYIMMQIFLFIVIVVWLLIGFFDILFRSCMFFPYLYFLERHNLQIKVGRLSWHTTAFNRTFYRLGLCSRRLWRTWFALGTLISCLAIPAALWTLVSTLLHHFGQSPTQEAVLQPVLPGINLPLSHMFYYLAAIPICSIFHELGHAIAAAREHLKIQGSGILVLGIFPGAFVELLTEQVALLTPWKQLLVFCAGVWHNVVLALAALGLIWCLPLVVSPAYFHLDTAVAVAGTSQGSGISGPTGLAVGDRITAINSCRITDQETWKSCLWETYHSPITGYCVPALQVAQQGDSSCYCFSLSVFIEEHRDKKNTDVWNYWMFVPSRLIVIRAVENCLIFKRIIRVFYNKLAENCCQKESTSGLCFSVLRPSMDKTSSCLPARKMLQISARLCLDPDDCPQASDVCLVPEVAGDNTTRLIQISRVGKEPVLFLGNPLELLVSVNLTPWYPRFSWLPTWLPYSVDLFLKYIVLISGGLALLNVVPCAVLDGEKIVQALVPLCMPWLSPQHQRMVIASSTVTGTILVVANIILGIRGLIPS